MGAMHGMWLAAAVLAASAAGMLAGPVMAAPAADGVRGAWVRINPAPGRPAAGYFSMTNGPAADALVAAETPGARVELHSMTMDGGVMRMRQMEQLELAAGETVMFKPGGYHLMLFGLEKADGMVPITLKFRSGAKVEVMAEVRKAGGAAGGMHEGH